MLSFDRLLTLLGPLQKKHTCKTREALLLLYRGHATSQKVAGSIPDGVTGSFDIILPAAPWPWGPSASNGNEYQGFSREVNVAGV